MKPENNQENSKKCSCPHCPVHNKCMKEKDEKLFCGRNISACEPNSDKMCICGWCEVYRTNKLSGGYFCIHELQ